MNLQIHIWLYWAVFRVPLFTGTPSSTQMLHIQRDCDCSNRCTFLLCQYKLYKRQLREYEIAVDDQFTSRRGPEVERVYFVILELAPVTYVDSSAVQALKELYQEYKSRNIQIAIANPNQDVQSTLAKSGFIDLVGREWCFVRVHDAVQVCLQHVQNSTSTSSSNLTASPRTPRRSIHNSFSYERLTERRREDISASEMESGERGHSLSKDADPTLEPLLLGKFREG